MCAETVGKGTHCTSGGRDQTHLTSLKRFVLNIFLLFPIQKMFTIANFFLTPSLVAAARSLRSPHILHYHNVLHSAFRVS